MKVTETHEDGSRFFHDIEDPVAFISATLNKAIRGGLPLTGDEFDELVLEGLLILTKMATAWHSGHQHSRKGEFSGYVAMFLPKRLGDAWHRMHPNHRYITNPETGRRAWHYDPPAVSYDALASDPLGGEQQLSRARRPHEFVPTPTGVAA